MIRSIIVLKACIVVLRLHMRLLSHAAASASSFILISKTLVSETRFPCSRDGWWQVSAEVQLQLILGFISSCMLGGIGGRWQ